MSTQKVRDWYANIPIDDTIHMVKENLLKSKIYNVHEVDDILRLLRVVLKQNYFSFNGKIYYQKEGLAMGSPLSGLLADIFMNNFERKNLMSNNTYKNKIRVYRRYVDDTFILFDGTVCQLEAMILIKCKVQFTVEHEENDKTNFLDVTVIKKDGSLIFKVYRKPTTTNATIHRSSFHPKSQKMAAYNSMIHRAVTFPLSPEDFKEEINIIKHIAVSNGYSSTIVDDLLAKKKRKHPAPPTDKKFTPVQFNSFTLPIANFLRRHNYAAGLSISNNMLKLLTQRRNRDKPTKDKSGCIC